MSRRMTILLVVWITISLACNMLEPVPTSVSTPEKDDPPVVQAASVEPKSGMGSFNGTVSYKHGSDAGFISCRLSNLGTMTVLSSFQIDVPADKSLSSGSESFSIELTDPGEYSLDCSDPTGGGVSSPFKVVAPQATGEATQEGPFTLPEYGDWSTADLYLYYKEATTNVPGLDPGHGCWPLNYWADDSRFFTVSNLGVLDGGCHFQVRNETMNGTITGDWNELTGEVTWHLETTHVVVWEKSQITYTNRVDGTGKFTKNDTATGSATWTTTQACTDLSTDGSGCFSFNPQEGTGTVEWFMVFTK